MSTKRGKSRVKVSVSKPELPPFLQKIREQLVADEDSDRRDKSEKKRKSRPIQAEDPEDAPELIRVGDDDITEEEFNRMKEELDSKYRSDNKKARTTEDLDMDYLIKSRENKRILKAPHNDEPREILKQSLAKSDTASSSNHMLNPGESSFATRNTKSLNYGSSSSEEE